MAISKLSGVTIVHISRITSVIQRTFWDENESKWYSDSGDVEGGDAVFLKIVNPPRKV